MNLNDLKKKVLVLSIIGSTLFVLNKGIQKDNINVHSFIDLNNKVCFLSRTEDSVLKDKYSITQEFLNKTREISKDIGVNETDLLKIMSFETARTFSPKIKNKYSGATGLIQFMPDKKGLKYKTIRGNKYYISDLENMTDVEQLDVVKEYFLQFNREFTCLEDLYMAVLYPKAITKPLTYVLFKTGTTRYKQNYRLDTNKDGVITKKEISKIVSRY